MNKLTKSAAGLMLALSALTFTSCDDDSDIIGLNDAAKYGSIKVKIEGTRPDGEDYTLERTFKFASATGPEYSSSVYTSEDGDIYRDFQIVRYFGAINESGEGGSNNVYLEVDSQEGEEITSSGYFGIETPVITKDKQYFYVYEYFSINEEDVTSYSYNAETGKLTFKFTKELTADESYSDFPVTITGTATVTVFERIQSGNL
jgi:hypothetical protein